MNWRMLLILCAACLALLAGAILISCSGGDDDDNDSGTSDDDNNDNNDASPDDDDDDNDDNNDNDNDTVEDPVGLTWKSIPAGSFQMGCVPQDTSCEDSFVELPRHQVSISAFKMTETEVTQAQFQEVMGTNPSFFSGCDNCPVEMVSWTDAVEFCEQLGGRLPTEAEWEFSARANTETIYICGDNPACLANVAWYYPNSENRTHVVGDKQPNAWGLYDMSGNVQEWCSDWYDGDYYDVSPTQDPQGPTGPGGTGGRVLRGNSYPIGDSEIAITYFRLSVRAAWTPDTKMKSNGFRCAK